jgi:RNA polymerase sigma-70 factor (ECF subfamily)
VSSAVDPTRAGALGRASDEQLTSLVRRGNQDAFRALYERHQAIVHAVARAASRERAEDIAQETWTSAYRALSGPGKSIEHVGPWLATIARNIARDRYRQDLRKPEVADDDIVAAAPAAGGVESALEGKHNIGRLLGAFDELPDDQRVIFNLREFGGLTYKEIAEQLGKPESTIEAALFRARRKLAKEYAELHSGRRCRIVQSQLLTGRELSHVERRRLTRHLGRCTSCERVARLEGAEHLIPAPRLARIAGVVPVPPVLARVLASGGESAVRPLLGKAAVAAVAVVAGVGALVVSQRGGQTPGEAGPAAAAETPQGQMVMAAAPNVVRPYRVKAVVKRNRVVPAVLVRSTTTARAVPVAATTPSTPVTTKTERTVVSQPIRTQQPTSAPQAPAQTPAPQTPAAAQPSAPTAAPVATPVTQATVAPASQPTRPAAPATPPARQQTPPSSGGPSVTQTATCLVADCSIQP